MNQVAQLIPTISSNEIVHSTCPYCGVGCGVTAQQTAKGLQVVGDESHPANRGKLCIKGSHLADTVGMSHRLITPQLGRGAARKQTSWDQATDLIADKFRQGSQLQNYILPLHNLSFYSTAKASFSIFIHYSHDYSKTI